MATNKSQEPIKTAILGCGAITELFHAPALKALEKVGQVRVTHLLDPSPERLDRIRGFFPQATVLQALPDVSAASPDMVVVASPVQFHEEQALASLEAGAAVLCEKPMAATAEEARRMIRAAEKNGRPLAIGLCRRFLPAACAIKQMLAAGVLGTMKCVHFQEGYDFNWPAQSPSFFQKKAGGGGVLLDLGVHVVDLLAWWFGTPSGIRYNDDAMGGVEANCELYMTFSGGFEVRIRLSRDHALRCFCRIEGENGWAEWRNVEAGKLKLKLKGGSYLWNVELMNANDGCRTVATASGLQNAFLAQALNIVAAIRVNEAIRVPGSEGIRSLEIIEACYQNRHLMEMPWFTQAEKSAAYILNQQR